MKAEMQKITYLDRARYRWNITGANITSVVSAKDMDAICATCDSVKDEQIGTLKSENRQLKQQVSFLREELEELEIRTALDAPAVSLKSMVDELTVTPEGESAWQEAWADRKAEWATMVKDGKMSRVKYHRLLSGMDQTVLAERLETAQPNISRIERPGYNVPTKTLKKLAGIFGVKVEDLIGD